jgi:fucose 4-O-acetylase-like acetyltransferase
MKRIAYIDLIKVFAIFFVILGHSIIWTGFPKQWVYSFHMPVFFALYGMTYNFERHVSNGFLTLFFFKNKFIRLMIPVIIWAIGYSIVSSFNDSTFHLSNLMKIAYFSQASLRHAGSLSSIWFIPCMFMAVLLTELSFSFIYKMANKAGHTNRFVVFFILVLASITFVLPRISRGYPWCVNLVPLATAMILMGYLVRQSIDATSKWCANHRLTLPSTFLLAFCTLILMSWLNWQFITGKNVDMATAKFGNPLLYMIGAISGLVMLVALSKLICPLRLNTTLAFIGANTYGIFLIHKPLIIKMEQFLESKGYGNLFVAFFSAIVILFLSAVLTYIVDRIYPPLIGNKRKTTLKMVN